MNTLYYGDNLKILRDYIKDESVDLIYLDPPFNSNRNYNVLFRNETGNEAEAQITAFEDTWHWNLGAEQTYSELINEPDQVGRMIESFRQFIGTNQMMAYLVMMAVRLKELHSVLKPTGSLYLHCDPTASHYLKLLLDAVFGITNFQSEIIWKRTSAHSGAKRYGPIHDTILFYTKSDEFVWNEQLTAYDETYIEAFFTHVDEKGRRWCRTDLTGPGVRKGESGLPWRSYDPTAKGRHWQPPSYFYDRYERLTGKSLASLPLIDRLEAMDALDMIHWPAKDGGMPRGKRYLDDAPGIPAQDVWTDLKPIHNMAPERLGYPTQKPVALLERIISASSNEGDIVLDPFCGCGTTIAAAQKLNREWIGIDITHLSVGLQKLRLRDSFGLTALTESQASKYGNELPSNTYKVVGQPEDLAGAKELAEKDKYGFQWWILPLIGAKAFGSERGKKEGKKGADGGIDGNIVFTDDASGKAKRVIVSVKGGHVNVAHIRELGHVIDRENAAIGVYVTLEPPTKPMLTEAAEKGFYHSPGWNKDYPRIQILTVEDILAGKTVNLPPNLQTFKQAEKVVSGADGQGSLGFDRD